MTRDDICSKFIESVPYTLYPFQEEAILAWYSTEAGVLVCAPTGMGKTLIAEAAIFEALHSRKRLYYTTPLIALTDQKYREIQQKAVDWGFRADDVGLITGNRKENADAPIRVVVAEILLNHLLARDPALAEMPNVGAVVMDEFHSFNDPERGIVWELALCMLPPHVRVMLLSATVGNPFEFADWLKDKHGRKLDIVMTHERRVPLEFIWVDDHLLTEHLPQMEQADRTPALVFCFNRDECWEVAEKLKGLPLNSAAARKEIERQLESRIEDLREGVGPKLRQMLIRGVGVHHAGVLPRHKQIVEDLFLQKLVPFVVCTETLAAGINLPARSVVLSTLVKGPPREKKLIPPSTAHQMFGRAGRPQFDTKGYVYAVAHDDDVKIKKWKKKYDQINPESKDPVILRLRREMERKRPTRRANEQYWTEGQFKALIDAGPAKLQSRAMIPYSVLIFQLTRNGDLGDVRQFLSKRFNTRDRLDKFQQQLDFMVGNLAALGYLEVVETAPLPDRSERPAETRSARPGILANHPLAPGASANPAKLEQAQFARRVELREPIYKLLTFRSVDPLFGAFLCETLLRSNEDEKLVVLDSLLEMPPQIARKCRIPHDMPKGPLQEHEIEPLMVQLGIKLAREETEEEQEAQRRHRWLARNPEDQVHPPTFPEMLKQVFDVKLPAPEETYVQAKWMAGAAFRFFDCDFFKFVRSYDLVKQEGLVLRHLLRFAILAGEFFTYTQDPSYSELTELAVRTCRRVDEQYTSHFLADALADHRAAREALRR